MEVWPLDKGKRRCSDQRKSLLVLKVTGRHCCHLKWVALKSVQSTALTRCLFWTIEEATHRTCLQDDSVQWKEWIKIFFSKRENFLKMVIMTTLKRKRKKFKIYTEISTLNELTVFKCFGECVCVCVFMMACVQRSEVHSLVEVGSLLSPRGSQGLNSCHQAPRQALVPRKPPLLLFCF